MIRRTSFVLAVFAAMASVLHAQQLSTPPTPSLTFEVASIKPSKTERSSSGIRMATGDRLLIVNSTLRQLVGFAYGARVIESTKVPDWVESDRFDIAAKAERAASRPELMLMLQQLLSERFRLQVHKDTREMAIYELVLAGEERKLGPQVIPSSPADYDPAERQKRCNDVAFRARENPLGFCGNPPLTMAQLASLLSYLADRKVIDKTQLDGTYDIELYYSTNLGPESTGIPLSTALREQLGLKLNSSKGPVEVLVIDYVEPPTPD